MPNIFKRIWDPACNVTIICWWMTVDCQVSLEPDFIQFFNDIYLDRKTLMCLCQFLILDERTCDVVLVLDFNSLTWIPKILFGKNSTKKSLNQNGIWLPCLLIVFVWIFNFYNKLLHSLALSESTQVKTNNPLKEPNI